MTEEIIKIRLNFQYSDESWDSLIVSGTIEEIRDIASKEYAKRGCIDAYSEVVGE